MKQKYTMNKYVILLRAINVSGHHIIKMKDLLVSLSSLGYQNIQTYLQSGNVIFESENNDVTQLEDQIRDQILNDFGHDITVMVFFEKYFIKVYQNNPLLGQKEIDQKKLYVAFLNTSPDQVLLSEIVKKFPEIIIMVDKILYVYYTNGYGRTKVNNNFFEKKLKVIATTRNWNTVSNIYQKLIN